MDTRSLGYLGLGALEAGMASWVMPVLITSSVLNAAYFLPVLYRAWFRTAAPAWPAEHIAAEAKRLYDLKAKHILIDKTLAGTVTHIEP